jgi:hypothetical protein
VANGSVAELKVCHAKPQQNEGHSSGMISTALAELPPDAHVDAQALASLLGRCKRSIQRAWRRGELPPPITFLGKHVWLVSTILKHMATLQAKAVKETSRSSKNTLKDLT